eukprot:jgi/Botrbrau1/1722/Bobra.116_2s0064.1
MRLLNVNPIGPRTSPKLNPPDAPAFSCGFSSSTVTDCLPWSSEALQCDLRDTFDAFTAVVRYRSIAEELRSPNREQLRRALSSEDTSTNACIYLLLRAADVFHTKHGRYPGTLDSVDEDTVLLKNTVGALLAEIGVGSPPVLDDVLCEIVRCGAGLLHCVAAFMGGIASQEAIKLITRQFVPLGGTLIYNAMASTSSVFRV